uniref:Uncharacterized protein n=2 Tax=Cannabis sativa TaxID=3483 RepID=A0A803R458_CANSA
MNPQYKLLQEITPTTRGWIAKVTVIKKFIPPLSRNGVLYQRIILVDIDVYLLQLINLYKLYKLNLNFVSVTKYKIIN